MQHVNGAFDAPARDYGPAMTFVIGCRMAKYLRGEFAN
jgi:hypothetical protein